MQNFTPGINPSNYGGGIAPTQGMNGDLLAMLHQLIMSKLPPTQLGSNGYRTRPGDFGIIRAGTGQYMPYQ